MRGGPVGDRVLKKRGSVAIDSTGAPENQATTGRGPRLSAPAEPAPAMPDRLSIVGIGASAGGLEAFEHFFRQMPADSGLAFVLVQHLDPSHASILSEILQRCTAMPVVEVRDEMAVVTNQIHVIPPNRDMVVSRRVLQLSVPTEPRGQRMPIDAFLRSLAEDIGEDAIGIVLSGTGTDGTLGMRAIFGAGGLCLVQDPATAKYDGMPTSAIRAGYAHQVLAVDKMPQALRDGIRLPPARTSPGTPAPEVPPATMVGGLKKTLLLLRTATGHDFSQYKPSTIRRRVERRMAQHGIPDAEAYACFLREHPEEIQPLFRQLLINVTSFFRDPQAFDLLKREVLEPMIAERAYTDVLRIWVAGCASGEEAYSIAMVLRELLDEMQRDVAIQLYSTDIDDDAITAARAGLYPPNIAQDVSAERLRRFFAKDSAGFRVKKEIREMVVFALQSVIKDPPFTRLDLLACRNLMIYLEPELQGRLIPTFHYALKPGGVLFLSTSESVGNRGELFEPIDRKWKLYRARPGVASTRAVLSGGLSWAADSRGWTPQRKGPGARESQIAELARRTLLQSYAPAAVVTDLQGNLLHVHGETGRYLRLAPGQPTRDVVEMARDGLQPELREALRLAASQGRPTLNRPLKVRADGVTQAFNLSVRLVHDPVSDQNVLLLTFQDTAEPGIRRAGGAGGAGKAVAKVSPEAQRIEELERDLSSATLSMNTLLEEQQASNEELKSTNEELQSTNEELETSKEELQSVNEELVTVNSELQAKIEQLVGMQDDMKNLLDNIQVGTIFLDRKLSIRRFTREAVKVYRLVATDLGRPLGDIRSELQGNDLLADALTVLNTLTPIERDVRTPAGACYLARIQPYRTVDNVIDGVVMTFADITDRLQAVTSRKARDVAEAIVDAVPLPLAVLDGELMLISANRSYFRSFGGSAEASLGRPFLDLGDPDWRSGPLRGLLEVELARDGGFEQRTVVQPAGNGSRRLRLSARRVGNSAGAGDLVLLSIEAEGP